MKNNEIKILLTIIMEGGTLVRKSEPEIIKYKITKRDLSPKQKWKDKQGYSAVDKGSRTHYPLIAKPGTQSIKMTKEAYDNMTSTYCPSWSKFNMKQWKKLTPIQRLEVHLKRTSEHFGGKSFSYEILED